MALLSRMIKAVNFDQQAFKIFLVCIALCSFSLGRGLCAPTTAKTTTASESVGGTFSTNEVLAGLQRKEDDITTMDDVIQHVSKRSSQSNNEVICIPLTMSELQTKLSNFQAPNGIPKILPFRSNQEPMTIGIHSRTLSLLNNSTLSKCINSSFLHDDPNRFPRYVLLTQCDITMSSPCDTDVANYVPGDRYNKDTLRVLKRQTECENGKEKWALHILKVPHCEQLTT